MKRKTLSMSVILIIFLTFVVGIIISLYFFVFQPHIQSYITKLIEVNSVETTKHLTSEINEKFLIMSVQVSSTESALNSFDHFNTELLDTYFQNQSIDSLIESEFVLTDMDGVIYYTYPNNDLIMGHNESLKSYFLNASELDDVYVSKPYKSIETGNEKITLALKSTDYFLITNIDLSYLDEIFEIAIESDSQKEMMIVDRYGIIIYDSSSKNDDIQLPLEEFQSIRTGENNVIFDLNYDNQVYKATKSTIEQTDWTVIFFQDSIVFSDYASFIQIILIDFIVIILFIIILLLSIATYIFGKKITAINKGLSEMAMGHYDNSLEHSPVRILNSLSENLNFTSKALIEYNQKLNQLAYFDQLTGLYNRESLKLKFQRQFDKSNFNILLINIKRFSLYNESYGFDIGNEILRNVAKTLNSVISDQDIIGRLENDKFCIFTTSESYAFIQKIQDCFTQSITVGKMLVNINLKYYILEHINQDSDFDQSIKNLQQLISQEKTSMKDIHVFKTESSDLYERQIDIELSLEESLVNRDFRIVYQPIVSKDRPNEIRGFEALARWKHKKLNVISPLEFIPILEKTNKIHRLDQFVIFESIKEIGALSRRYNKKFILSCNVSVETILWDGFVDFIKSSIERLKYNPALLEIEITESTIIRDPIAVKSIINELTSYGIRFSQDDFGDGYSSLNYLTQLHISTLKISKNIIDHLCDGYNNRLLVQTVIHLAHELGFEVVAEGVETPEVLSILVDQGCDFIQGYLFYKPLPLQVIEDVMKQINLK